jgi:hypothetical protein
MWQRKEVFILRKSKATNNRNLGLKIDVQVMDDQQQWQPVDMKESKEKKTDEN